MTVSSEFKKMVRDHRPRYHVRLLYNHKLPTETQSFEFWKHPKNGPLWSSIVPRKNETPKRWDVQISSKRKADLEHAVEKLLGVCGLPESVQEDSDMATIVKSLATWGRLHGTKVGLVHYAIGCLERGYMVETGPKPPKADYIA